MTTLSIDDISLRIPHRFENLLLDSCTILDNNEGEFEVNLTQTDALGRSIFIYDHQSTPSIPIPLLPEIGALASISSANQLHSDDVATYFAAITQFSCPNGPFPIGHPIRGKTKRLSGKNDFYKYQFRISSGDFDASGQLMAYYDRSGGTKTDSPAPINCPDHVQACLSSSISTISEYKEKAPHLTFVSTCHLLNSTSAVYGYQYPANHPFIKGHFPNNPVMMGICQWLMLEDGMAHALSQWDTLTDTSLELSCNAIIFKSDLTPACDIKAATLQATFHNDHWHVSSTAVKKIMFKQRVVPNDQLFIYISDITIH